MTKKNFHDGSLVGTRAICAFLPSVFLCFIWGSLNPDISWAGQVKAILFYLAGLGSIYITLNWKSDWANRNELLSVVWFEHKDWAWFTFVIVQISTAFLVVVIATSLFELLKDYGYSTILFWSLMVIFLGNAGIRFLFHYTTELILFLLGQLSEEMDSGWTRFCWDIVYEQTEGFFMAIPALFWAYLVFLWHPRTLLPWSDTYVLTVGPIAFLIMGYFASWSYFQGLGWNRFEWKLIYKDNKMSAFGGIATWIVVSVSCIYLSLWLGGWIILNQFPSRSLMWIAFPISTIFSYIVFKTIFLFGLRIVNSVFKLELE